MNRIKELRLSKNLSQDELAIILKTTKFSISRWELEKTEPDNASLKELANYFDVSIDYLLGRTDDPRPFPVEDTRTIDERWNDPHNTFLYAMYGEVQDLTDDEKEEILKYVDYLKSKKKNK